MTIVFSKRCIQLSFFFERKIKKQRATLSKRLNICYLYAISEIEKSFCFARIRFCLIFACIENV